MPVHLPRGQDPLSPVYIAQSDFSSLLLHLASEIFLLDARNVFPRNDNQAEVAVGQLHLDGGSICAGGGCCFGSLFGGRLAVLVGVC